MEFVAGVVFIIMALCALVSHLHNERRAK